MVDRDASVDRPTAGVNPRELPVPYPSPASMRFASSGITWNRLPEMLQAALTMGFVVSFHGKEFQEAAMIKRSRKRQHRGGDRQRRAPQVLRRGP